MLSIVARVSVVTLSNFNHDINISQRAKTCPCDGIYGHSPGFTCKASVEFLGILDDSQGRSSP